MSHDVSTINLFFKNVSFLNVFFKSRTKVFCSSDRMRFVHMLPTLYLPDAFHGNSISARLWQMQYHELKDLGKNVTVNVW